MFGTRCLSVLPTCIFSILQLIVTPFFLYIKDQRCLEEASNEILTAIVHGMKREEPSDHVRLAATNALLNSLEFTKANFDKEVRSAET